jgi:hypothetical protein
MGNHQTVPLISCQVEKDFGNAGEVIHGLVRLQVDGEQPLQHFEGVTITLAGMEYDLSLDPNGKLHRSNGVRVKLTQQISDFENGSLPPGIYQFPFELELPDEIAPPPPPSGALLSLNGCSDNSAYISTECSSTSSEMSDLPAADEPFREVAYKIRASLKRKHGVPLNSDTHVWCQAVLRKPTTSNHHHKNVDSDRCDAGPALVG